MRAFPRHIFPRTLTFLSAMPTSPADATDAVVSTPAEAPLAVVEVSEGCGVVAAKPAKEGEVPPHEVDAAVAESIQSAHGSTSKESLAAHGWPSKWPLEVDQSLSSEDDEDDPASTWVKSSGRRRRSRPSTTARQRGDASCSAK